MRNRVRERWPEPLVGRTRRKLLSELHRRPSPAKSPHDRWSGCRSDGHTSPAENARPLNLNTSVHSWDRERNVGLPLPWGCVATPLTRSMLARARTSRRVWAGPFFFADWRQMLGIARRGSARTQASPTPSSRVLTWAVGSGLWHAFSGSKRAPFVVAPATYPA